MIGLLKQFSFDCGKTKTEATSVVNTQVRQLANENLKQMLETGAKRGNTHVTNQPLSQGREEERLVTNS